MSSALINIFQDKPLIKKIQERMPVLFHLAEIESSRAGHVGMEVGSLRETIIIALLASVFGVENVETNISIIESEVDVRVCGSPISIKTKTGSGMGGIKACWTVDAVRIHTFARNYHPECDILLIVINWDRAGGLFYIPIEVQREILGNLGIEAYLKLPKPDTNPRGVEFASVAIERAVRHPESKNIPILWKRPNININKYERWIKYWQIETFEFHKE